METKRAPRGPLDLAGRVDWTKHFGREAPLEVEIGAGHGGFCLGHAKAHPTRDLVALEVRRKFAKMIEEKRAKRELRNLLVLAADAKVVLPRMFAPRSIAKIHIQFPDPWWKRRHHGRRLVEDEFSVLLYNLLAPGGRIELRTDVEARGAEMVEVLEAIGFVNLFGEGGLAPYDPSEVPSSREKGYLERGQPIYRYKLSRSEAPAHAAPDLPASTVGLEQRRR